MGRSYIKYIILLIAISLLIYLSYVFITKYMSQNENDTNNIITNEQVNESTKTVKFEGYQYQAIDDYNLKVKNIENKYNKLLIYNNVLQTGGQVFVFDKEKLKEIENENIDALKQELIDSGDIIKSGKIIERNNNIIKVFEYINDNNNALLAYMKVNEKKYYEITVYDENNTYNYGALNSIIDILNTRKKIN